MKRIVFIFILSLFCAFEVWAVDFTALESVYVKKGERETFGTYTSGSIEKTSINVGYGYEDVLRLDIKGDAPDKGIVRWFGKCYSSRLMFCDLLNKTYGYTKSVYVITYKWDGIPERCVIFYPDDDNKVTIYDVDPQNVNEGNYCIVTAYGKGLYMDIVHAVTGAMDENYVAPKRCDGYLDNLYIISKTPQQK